MFSDVPFAWEHYDLLMQYADPLRCNPNSSFGQEMTEEIENRLVNPTYTVSALLAVLEFFYIILYFYYFTDFIFFKLS